MQEADATITPMFSQRGKAGDDSFSRGGYGKKYLACK